MQSQRQPWLASLSGWLSSLDPGWVRLENAARAVLVMIVVLLVCSVVIPLLTGRTIPQITLFSFFAAFICSITVADSQVAERKRTALLAFFPLSLAVLLAALFPTESSRVLNHLSLLVLIFIAFYVRRFGVRAGELAMIGTIGFYIASENVPTLDTLPFFIVGIAVVITVYFLFQFFILPYDPLRYVRRGISAFYQPAAALVESMIQTLQDTEAADPMQEQRMERRLRQIHTARKVIARELVAIAAPIPEQQKYQLLGLQLYSAESGLEIMVRGVTDLAHQETALPNNIRQLLVETLAALRDDLSTVSSAEQKATLLKKYDSLQQEVRAGIATGERALWRLPFLQVVVAGGQAARAVDQARTLAPSSERPPEASQAPAPTPHPPAPPAIPVQIPLLGERNLHPTIILGIQAVTAVAAAMLLSNLLNLVNPNWAYWTAFVVVVGSAGETLRKSNQRVFGTLAGGVAAALLLFVPGLDPFIPLMILVCVFMCVFTITINYAYFVFWITIMVMLLDGGLGGEVGVVLERTINVVIGAVVATMVVRYILPIYISDRLKVALAHYLSVIDQYLTTIFAASAAQNPSPDVDTQKLKVADTFDALSQTFPSAVFEENRLTQAHSSLSNQTTAISVLNDYVTRLADQVESGQLSNSASETALIQTFQNHIHQNIQTLSGFLTSRQASPPPLYTFASVQESAGATSLFEQELQREGEPVSANRSTIFLLSRIHRTLLQVGEGFGAAIDSRQEPPKVGEK